MIKEWYCDVDLIILFCRSRMSLPPMLLLPTCPAPPNRDFYFSAKLQALLYHSAWYCSTESRVCCSALWTFSTSLEAFMRSMYLACRLTVIPFVYARVSRVTVWHQELEITDSMVQTIGLLCRIWIPAPIEVHLDLLKTLNHWFKQICKAFQWIDSLNPACLTHIFQVLVGCWASGCYLLL